MRLRISLFSLFFASLALTACGDDDGGNTNGNVSGNDHATYVEVPSEFAVITPVGDLACGVMMATFYQAVFTCFAEDGTQSHTIPIHGLQLISSSATLDKDKVVLVPSRVPDYEGAVFVVVDLTTDTFSDPIPYHETRSTGWAATGMPNGSVALLNSQDGTLVVVDTNGSVVSEEVIEGIEEFQVGNGTITAVDNNTLAILHSFGSSHVSLWDLTSHSITVSFVDDIASASTSSLQYQSDGKLHLLRLPYAGHGEPGHLYDDVFDTSGNLIETRKFFSGFNHDEGEITQDMVLLDNGAMAAYCSRLEDGDPHHYVVFMHAY